MEEFPGERIRTQSLIVFVFLFVVFRLLLAEWELFLFPEEKTRVFLEANLPAEQVDATLSIKDRISKWRWIIIPFTALLGSLLLAYYGYLTGYFTQLNKLTLRHHFKAVLCAQIVASVYFATRLFLVMKFAPKMTLEQWQTYYPGSFLAYMDPLKTDPWWMFSFAQLNIGNLLFMLTLVVVYVRIKGVSAERAFQYVSISWGGGLILILSLITFVQMMIMN